MLNIDKLGFSNIWITADWHINHLNLHKGTSKWLDISKCRDFNTPDEGWRIIKDNCNSLANENDLIINLGDIIFGVKTKLPLFLDEIKCKNWIYIKGNHCDWLNKHKNIQYQQLFNFGCFDYLECIINEKMFILSHYLLKTWREQANGAIQLGGHSHGNLPDDPNALSMDVGVDTCLFGHKKYTPYSAEEIFHIMDNFKKPIFLDHHQPGTD